MLTKIAQEHAAGTLCLAKLTEEEGVKTIVPVGSTFLCHAKGYLLTCAHTFSLTDRLVLIGTVQQEEFLPLTQTSAECIDVTVAQYDAINDVALLKFGVSVTVSMPQSPFGDESTVALGALCALLGYPFADRGLHVRHISSAFVSAKVLSKTGTRQFQLDGTAHEGCSGGPLIDVKTGKLVGIVSGRFAPSGGQGGLSIGGYALGNDSSISYATAIRYGLNLMKTEGLDV